MPIARIGYGTDFILKDQGVGIATDTADIKLKVGGTTKANYNISGIASLTNYAGFAAAEQSIDGTITLTGEHSTLGDIVVGIGSTFIVSSGSTVEVGTVPSVSIGTHFSPPCGGINDRPEVPVEGTVRFNKDLNTLEFYNGVDWRQFTVSGASGRAVIGGGNHSTDFTTDISYFSTVTQGNGINFGDLTQARRGLAAISSEIRGIWGGGRSPTERDTMDYVTIASAGNAIDFGNRIQVEYSMGGLSSSTRGLIFGGAPASDDIHYTTIATLGNEIDFGSLRVGRRYCSGFASPTRGVMGGGNPDYKSSMEYITIASVGNATDFGDLSQGRYGIQASSNTTRGVWMGGYHTSPVGSTNKVIDYNIIASTGNALNFGDLSKTRYYGSGTSNQTRGFAITGYTQPSNAVDSSIEYVTINSAGNAVDFGDVSMAKYLSAGCSDSHGGLGGY